jgi:hypothetical protein
MVMETVMVVVMVMVMVLVMVMVMVLKPGGVTRESTLAMTT